MNTMIRKRILTLLLALMVGMVFSFADAEPVSAVSKPGKVKTVKVKALSQSSISISWSKSKKASGYLLYRNETLVKTGKKRSFTDKGLKPGLQYTYVVLPYKTYKKTQWFNKKTGKWQSKKPKKKWRGKKKRVKLRKYGSFSAMKTATTKGTRSARPVLKLLLPASSDKNVEPFVARYNATDSRYTIQLVKTSTAAGIDPASYDGLIIPGGAHVHPSFYGDSVRCNKHPFNKNLDRLEIALVQSFADAGKPILGLCRGAQVINVALGGTLKQDIGMGHYNDSNRQTTTVAGTAMRSLFGGSVATIHYHHQAVSRLAAGLTVTMVDARDGTVEAFSHTSLPIIGYQFHPDRMYLKTNPGIRYTGKLAIDYFFGICYAEKQKPPVPPETPAEPETPEEPETPVEPDPEIPAEPDPSVEPNPADETNPTDNGTASPSDGTEPPTDTNGTEPANQ